MLSLLKNNKPGIIIMAPLRTANSKQDNGLQKTMCEQLRFS